MKCDKSKQDLVHSTQIHRKCTENEICIKVNVQLAVFVFSEIQSCSSQRGGFLQTSWGQVLSYRQSWEMMFPSDKLGNGIFLQTSWEMVFSFRQAGKWCFLQTSWEMVFPSDKLGKVFPSDKLWMPVIPPEKTKRDGRLVGVLKHG
jgi:hypothetical protein